MKKKMSHKQIDEIASKLSVLKNELLELGLIKTYHEMDKATKQVGWEVAEIIEGEHPLIELES